MQTRSNNAICRGARLVFVEIGFFCFENSLKNCRLRSWKARPPSRGRWGLLWRKPRGPASMRSRAARTRSRTKRKRSRYFYLSGWSTLRWCCHRDESPQFISSFSDYRAAFAKVSSFSHDGSAGGDAGGGDVGRAKAHLHGRGRRAAVVDRFHELESSRAAISK